MRRFLFALIFVFAASHAYAQDVKTLVQRDLGEPLALLTQDAGRSAVERQFGTAYARDWWSATGAILDDAKRWAAYLAEQGPECAAIKAPEGDASSGWVTCQTGMKEAATALEADLAQLETALPEWERMVRQIDTANTAVSPRVDRALAAIRAIRARLADPGY
ncbi:MAG: hypothetical protein C6Y20_15915 [Tagaea sp. CACIAM 22H2]|nr:hypothetical protein [Tagaea sp. CACIAM 22H2]